MVSKRLQEIPASGTIAISNLVSQMKSEGIDIVSFSMGEPDFTTPENIIDACCDSLHRGFTHYTPSMGIPELRKAIADMTRTNNNVPCDASNVLVTPCKQAIFMTMLAYIDPGDEVILADPSWVSYEACVRLAGGVPVYVPTRFEDNFVLDPALVEAAITPRTKMIILNTPSNPTGAVIPADVLKQIADIAMAHNIKVFSDEIYEAIVYEGKHTSIASFPGMFENTIIVSGLSKSYAMTGWRLGYACGPEPIIKIMTKIHQSAIMSAPTTSQYAAITALRDCDGEIDRMRDEYNMRRRLVVRSFNDMGLTCFEPRGAFYAFPCIRSTGMSSQEFCTKLLEQKHVAIIPGDAFGASGEGYCRVSYAYSVEHLTEALKRIREFLQENSLVQGN